MKTRCSKCKEFSNIGACSYSCKKKPEKVIHNGKNYTMTDIISLIQKNSGIKVSLSVVSVYVREIEKLI